MKTILIATTTVLLIGCGSDRPAAESSPAEATKAPVQAPPTDKIGAAPEPTVKPGGTASAKGADTTKLGTPAPKDDRLRDSASGPKYMVDSTGKVTPIKPKKP